MNLLLIISLWVAGCGVLAYLNARFWRIMPDTEQEQYEQDKADNLSPINPVTKDNWHLVKILTVILVVVVLGILIFA